MKPATPNETISPLRQDIRMLGRTLGEVIRDCEGRAVYDVIEKLRRAAVKFRREGQDRDGRMLERQIRRLADGEANSVARAFSYFLHLSNIAEDRDQTRRQRRQWQAEGPAVPGSLGTPSTCCRPPACPVRASASTWPRPASCRC